MKLNIKSLFFYLSIFLILFFFIISVLASEGIFGYCEYEVLNSQNKLLNNSNSEVKNFEISIFPERNNINCVGKLQDFKISESYSEASIYSSTNFQRIFNFIFLFLNLIFILFNKQKNLLYMSSLVFLQFSYLRIFINDFEIYKFILESLISSFALISLYFLTQNKNQKKGFKLTFSTLIYTLYIDYDHFFWAALLFLIFAVLTKNNLQINKKYLQSYFIGFYFLRIAAAITQDTYLWRKLSSNIYESPYFFNDLKILFQYFNCNHFSEVSYCAETLNLGYGPLTMAVSFENNYELLTILTSIILIGIYLFVGSKAIQSSKIPIFVFLTLLSPPVNFAVERMNMDFIIMLTFFLLLNNYDKNFLITSLLIFVFVLLKLYLIAALFTLGVVGFKNNNFKIFSFNFFLTFVCLLYLGTIFYNNNSLAAAIPNPFGHSWSYGLVSLYKNLFQLGVNISFENAYIIFLVILGFLIFKLHNFKQRFFFKNEYLMYSVISIYVLTSLFSNFDYRLVIFIPLLTLNKFSNKISSFEIALLFFLFTSVSPYVDPLSFSLKYGLVNILNSSVVVVNTFLFLLTLSYSILLLLDLISTTFNRKLNIFN